MNRHGFCFFLCLFLLCGRAAEVLAQSPPVDLTELSLEELLGLRVVSHAPQQKMQVGKEAGTFNIGYRFLSTHFEDYREGTRRVRSQKLLDRFPVVPFDIMQQAHILGLAYQWNETMALRVECPYIIQSTDHIRRSGAPFEIKTEGIGDIVAMTVLRLQHRMPGQLFITAGISLPTGSIDEKGDTPRGKNTQVPYTMQIGSGTYDFQPGALYISQTDWGSWGVEGIAKVRLGENDRNYSLGNRGTVSAWAATPLNTQVTPRVRATATTWQKIDGRDASLNPDLAPVADPDLFGGTRILLSAGAELMPDPISSESWRFIFDAGIPVYQDLNGPQPSQRWQASVHASCTF